LFTRRMVRLFSLISATAWIATAWIASVRLATAGLTTAWIAAGGCAGPSERAGDLLPSNGAPPLSRWDDPRTIRASHRLNQTWEDL
jgi:hypothetical protein